MTTVSESALSMVVIGGVRPQFIKVAALQRAVRTHNQAGCTQINVEYINSGQHYDFELAGAIIQELGIHFDYTLSHTELKPFRILSNMISGIHEILANLETAPRWVIVFGDASTTLAGALAAVRLGYPMVHIEAGVRSGDLAALEEVHRRVVSHVSSVHFCTSRAGVANLQAENISKRVYWAGDICYDFFVDFAQRQSCGIEPFSAGEYVLVTLHKSVNLQSDEILRNLVQTLSAYPRDVLFVHHPACRKRLVELGLHEMPGIVFSDSLPFGKMVSAIKGCAFIVTDSGGLQREAYYLGKRCLVRRDTLGWSGFVSAGIHRLIGTEPQGIVEGLKWVEATRDSGDYGFLDGFVRERAGEYILSTLTEISQLR